MKTMNPVVHFEMPYENKERMIDFYTNVFGWEMTKLGPDMMDYVLAKTAESGKKHSSTNKDAARGTIGGGFFPKNPDDPAEYPSIVISVDDIKSSIELIKSNGGKVLGAPMDIPGTGTFVSFIDTEGNRASIIE